MFIHPEKKVDEIFFTNCTEEQFTRMNWVTKRQGRIAYDGEGRRLPVQDWLPVFIAENELRIHHTNIIKERRKFREQHEVTIH